MADDWYRSSEWSPEAIEDFETRLQRSQKRSQYLRLKAIALIDAGCVEPAKMLLERVVDEHPDSLDTRHAQEVLGDLFREQGDLVRAEQFYRGLLESFPDLNATSREVRLSLGEVVLELHGTRAVEEVRYLLRDAEPDIRFNSTMFRALLLSALLAEAAGDLALQVSEAHRALELLDAGPQLSHKPTIGVPTPTDAQLADLRRLAGQ